MAEARLAQAKKEHKSRQAEEVDSSDAKMLFGNAATLHMQRLEEKVSIKKSTRKYWADVLAALLKTWPDLKTTEIRRITPGDCREWAARYAKIASPTRYNNTIAVLQHILNLAIKSGVIYSNPAKELERMPIRAKALELPTLAQFASFVAEINSGGGRDSRNCADLVQGIAFTGCRIGEAARIELRDLDFRKGEITVKGDPEEGTKNGEVRYVPMIPQAEKLFRGMLASRPDAPSAEGLFRVHECQKAMDRAAKKIGMARVTHHDLRHFFATVCIESGVDIPTVSRWLGHKDGGALAMRTYGHLRREHSVSQAKKVSFAVAE